MIKKALSNTLITVCFAFSSLVNAEDLLQSYQLALKADPNLLASKIQVELADSRQQQAQANLYPQANLSGSFSRNRLTGNQVFTQRYNGESIRLNVNQSILDVATYRESERLGILTNQSKKEYKQAQADLIVRVTEAYLDILAAKDLQKLNSAQIKFAEELVSQYEALYEKKLVTITQLYEAKTKLDQALSEQIQVNADRDIAFERLYGIIGKRITSISPLKLKSLPKQSISLEQWLLLAKQNNASIQAAQDALAAAKKEKLVKQASYYPSASFSVGYSRQNIGYDNAPAPQTNTLSVSLNLQQPIYQGGKRSAGTRESVQKIALSEQNLIDVRRKTEQAVREHYLGISKETENTKALYKLMDSESKRIEAIKAEKEYGSSTQSDYYSAIASRIQAETRLYQSRYNWLKHYFRLHQAAGKLNSEDVNKFNRWFE